MTDQITDSGSFSYDPSKLLVLSDDAVTSIGQITILAPDQQPLVTIHTQEGGRIEYGPNYTPDTAARAFWAAMQRGYLALADVQGRCPACGKASLFLGTGGYVTCRRIECPEPDAASTVLERRKEQP